MTARHSRLPFSQPREQEAGPIPAQVGWESLYRIGAVSALIPVILSIFQIAIFVTNPPPTTVIEWFTLFQTNRFVALIDHDLLLLVDWVLVIPMILALYAALKQANPGLTLLALLLGIVAVAVYLSSNTSLNMLALSQQYAAARTDAERSLYANAGQSMLAIYQGTGFQISYVLGALTPLLMSVVMLRSNLFSKTTATLGIIGNVIALGLFVPGIGIFLSIFSVAFLDAWSVLVARRLWRMASATGVRG